jgi:hypothetical protein
VRSNMTRDSPLEEDQNVSSATLKIVQLTDEHSELLIEVINNLNSVHSDYSIQAGLIQDQNSKISQMLELITNQDNKISDLENFNRFLRYSSYIDHIYDRLKNYINQSSSKQYKMYDIYNNLSSEKQRTMKDLKLKKESDLIWNNTQHRLALLAGNNVFHQKMQHFYKDILKMSDENWFYMTEVKKRRNKQAHIDIERLDNDEIIEDFENLAQFESEAGKEATEAMESIIKSTASERGLSLQRDF